MKKLQINYTTPEQSKRLLKLGVPVDSADCYYGSFGRLTLRQDNTLRDGFFETYESYTPCWSVGRLMEIAHICSGSTLSCKEEANEIQNFKEEHKCETLIEAVIVCIADAVSIGSIDFSKLED